MTDYLSSSIWFHTIMWGSLIGPSFVNVKARRAVGLDGSRFVSDEWGFVLYVIGLAISVVVVHPLVESAIAGIFQSTTSESITLANVMALICEFLAFRHFVLGR